jgi:hypothetical protein
MFARTVPVDGLDIFGVKLVESGIIQDENTVVVIGILTFELGHSSKSSALRQKAQPVQIDIMCVSHNWFGSKTILLI